jgi:hypothetical protein
MNRLIYLAAAATLALPVGCAAPPPNQPLDQNKIISVRPAYPEGAKAFVEQQRKIEEDRQKKPAFGNWLQKTPSQPAGQGSQTPAPPPTASSGKSFWDNFNPRNWGKTKYPASARPQQAPQNGQPNFSQQMPPPNTNAPTSQPGFGG